MIVTLSFTVTARVTTKGIRNIRRAPIGNVVPTPNVGRGAVYPEFPPYGAEDADPLPSQQYLNSLMTQFVTDMRDIFMRAGEEADLFDSYRPQSVGGESLTQLNIQSDYALQEVRTLIVTGPAGGFGSYSGQGRVVTPGASAVIAGTAVITQSGLYTVEWEVGIETAAATVADNFSLNFGGAPQEISENGTAVGVYPQNPVTIFIPAGNTVVVRSGLADATGTYSANVTATPYQGGVPFTLQLGDRAWQLQLPPAGIMVQRFNPGLQLKRNDLKQLLSATAGNWAVEMTGYRNEMSS